MSHEAVQTVLERTVADEAFRTRLFAEPDEALGGYDLTPSEVLALRELCVEQEDSEATALDQRQTKSVPFWLLG